SRCPGYARPCLIAGPGATRIHADALRKGAEITMSVQTLSDSTSAKAADQQRMEDVGFMTCMTLVWLGNYAQTGHFGGPLAYTPFNVAIHLAGPARGGLRYDYRRPKHPYSDK